MAQYTQILVIILAVVQAQSLHLENFRNSSSISLFLRQPKPKVFFFAGLEGSGLNLFETLWKSAWDTNSTDEHRHVLEFPPQWGCGTHWEFNGFYEMRDRFRNITKNELWAFPFNATFPSCGAWHHEHAERVLHYHPHLEWIKHAAEDAGVEFHVILFYRHLKDSLTLLCQKRNNENCSDESETLKANAIILKKQIEAIGDSAISCFNYPNEHQMMVDMFGNFDIHRLPGLRSMFRARKGDKVQKYLREEWLLNIRNESEALGKVCQGMPRFTIKDFKALVLNAYEQSAPTPRATARTPTVSNRTKISNPKVSIESAHGQPSASPATPTPTPIPHVAARTPTVSNSNKISNSQVSSGSAHGQPSTSPTTPTPTPIPRVAARTPVSNSNKISSSKVSSGSAHGQPSTSPTTSTPTHTSTRTNTHARTSTHASSDSLSIINESIEQTQEEEPPEIPPQEEEPPEIPPREEQPVEIPTQEEEPPEIPPREEEPSEMLPLAEEPMEIQPRKEIQAEIPLTAFAPPKSQEYSVTSIQKKEKEEAMATEKSNRLIRKSQQTSQEKPEKPIEEESWEDEEERWASEMLKNNHVVP